jgi:hypothetical protein
VPKLTTERQSLLVVNLTMLCSVNWLDENEQGLGNDVAGSDRGLFRKVISRNSPGGTEKYHEISQSRDSVSRSRLEPDIFRIQVRSSSA